MALDIKVIDKNIIEEEVNNMKLHGYRFGTMTCDKEGDAYELTYHFDKDYQMKHLRIIINANDTIKSVSSIYPAALLIENEYQDLYGFKFENLLIDYKGHLYLAESSPKAPMA